MFPPSVELLDDVNEMVTFVVRTREDLSVIRVKVDDLLTEKDVEKMFKIHNSLTESLAALRAIRSKLRKIDLDYGVY